MNLDRGCQPRASIDAALNLVRLASLGCCTIWFIMRSASMFLRLRLPTP